MSNAAKQVATPESASKSSEALNNTQSAEPSPISAPKYATVNSMEQCSIGRSLVIKGDVSGSESLFIDGRVEGSITLSGNATRVTVGKNGVVMANLSAREVVVMGKLHGSVVATERLDIRSEGSLTGDVVTQRISIEEGAYFKGGIDISRKMAEAVEPAKSGKTVSMPTANARTV
jgi:cytoskeletal protein CcmA (bactofilin family)